MDAIESKGWSEMKTPSKGAGSPPLLPTLPYKPTLKPPKFEDTPPSQPPRSTQIGSPKDFGLSEVQQLRTQMAAMQAQLEALTAALQHNTTTTQHTQIDAMQAQVEASTAAPQHNYNTTQLQHNTTQHNTTCKISLQLRCWSIPLRREFQANLRTTCFSKRRKRQSSPTP